MHLRLGRWPRLLPRLLSGLLLTPLLSLTPVLSVVAATPGGATPSLETRLGLTDLPSLKVVSSRSDPDYATYTLVAAQGVGAVLAPVRAQLLGQGWVVHPNLAAVRPQVQPATPSPLGLRAGRRVVSFAQAGELLELSATPVGRSNLVRLRITLYPTPQRTLE